MRETLSVSFNWTAWLVDTSCCRFVHKICLTERTTFRRWSHPWQPSWVLWNTVHVLDTFATCVVQLSNGSATFDRADAWYWCPVRYRQVCEFDTVLWVFVTNLMTAILPPIAGHCTSNFLWQRNAIGQTYVWLVSLNTSCKATASKMPGMRVKSKQELVSTHHLSDLGDPGGHDHLASRVDVQSQVPLRGSWVRTSLYRDRRHDNESVSLWLQGPSGGERKSFVRPLKSLVCVEDTRFSLGCRALFRWR